MAGFMFNIDGGYLEGLCRGFKCGILKQSDYLNLVQCETLEGEFGFIVCVCVCVELPLGDSYPAREPFHSGRVLRYGQQQNTHSQETQKRAGEARIECQSNGRVGFFIDHMTLTD